MRKSIFTLFLGCICIISILGGCSKVNKVSMTGRYLKASSGINLIIDEEGLPIVMGNSSNKEDIFEGLQTGDKIQITCNSEIRETYPAGTDIYSCKLIERGTIEDIPKETLKSLEEMEWTFDFSEIDN